MLINIKIPKYNIFGFRILNSLHSSIAAYLLFLCEFFLAPYFGLERIEYFASLLFIFLCNLSIIILIINSCIRINRRRLFLLILNIPLFIYLPFSIKKILYVLSNFILFFN